MSAKIIPFRIAVVWGAALLVSPYSVALEPDPPRVTVTELLKVYQTNDARADEYFEGKQVKVTGKMKRVWRQFEGYRDMEMRRVYTYRMEMELEGAKAGSVTLELIFPEE